MAPKSSIESSLLRRYGEALLHPTFARLSHERLMEASRECLQEASSGSTPETRIVTTRLLENRVSYQAWENEHSGLMRNVAAERLPASQRGTMLSASFSLIHRKALFEYLRDRQSSSTQREALIRHFFPQRDITDSLRSEHVQFVRSTASYLCVEHVGRDLMFDALFQQPLHEYEEIYHEYFFAHCDQIVALRSKNTLAIPAAMLSELKQRVSEWRKALLALTQSQSGTWRRPKF